ncbi:MAG: hypothetical protein GX946_00080 [Oligosphaeraceae bacterium]|nr:hypothetical protein [Oligosphaeraceae bacterium]
MATVDAKLFEVLIQERSLLLFSVAQKIVSEGLEHLRLTRPLLGNLQAESTQLEELLDSYGARSNSQWYVFRMQVAVLKNFSTAGYELLHLKHTSQGYNLEVSRDDFLAGTDDALAYVAAFSYCALQNLLEEGERFGWPEPEENLGLDFSEHLPPGRLPRDRKTKEIKSAEELIVRLATEFLNNTEDAKFLRVASRCKGPQWRNLNFDRMGEAPMRALEMRIHNLQSIYDTHVSDSETEACDTNLPKLRGHISIVLHILRVATIFAHFYERHFHLNAEALRCDDKNPELRSDLFLELFTHYLCRHAYEFLSSARSLCQEMLKKYAVISRVQLPIPPFFGFHARPSALVSSIVQHYGSDVRLLCGESSYDAGRTFDLFRVNGWIDQQKRQHVYTELDRLDLNELSRKISAGSISRDEALLEILRQLALKNTIQILQYPPPVAPIIENSKDNLRELAKNVIVKLHEQRALTIILDLRVTFEGDTRVLKDLQILAENSYGENEMGTNIALPKALGYLRHYRDES